MSGPAEIWLDERVVHTLKTEPDSLAELGNRELRYFSEERVAEITRQASGGDEFFIQVQAEQGQLLGLTNYGRIYTKVYTEDVWEEIPAPTFE